MCTTATVGTLASSRRITAVHLAVHASPVYNQALVIFADVSLLPADMSDIMKQDMERFAARQQAATASSSASGSSNRAQQQVRTENLTLANYQSCPKATQQYVRRVPV